MDFYLSDIIGNPVLNQSKEKIGTLSDLVITDLSKPHPVIKGFIIKRGGKKESVFIPKHDIAVISPKLIKLTTDVIDLTPFILRDDEVLLAKDVYDKQIVDVDDRRLTRVNDLLLENQENVVRLKGVDVSFLGILKRLQLPNVANILKRNIVDWEDVQFLGGQGPMKFNVQYQNLESMHPVDIARIIFEGPGYKQGSRVLASLKDPIAADILEELSPKLQQNLIESMKIEDVADVIDQMPPHKAADLLVALGSEYTQKVLPLLVVGHAEKITSLLNYPEHTTGAYMTTDYIAIPSGITVQEAFAHVSEMKEIPDFAVYFFVLENKYSNKLAGIVGAHEYLKADRRTRVDTIMIKKPILAHPHDNIKDSLKKMYRYNLSALPVVSKTEYKLLGIITFREAISIYLPKRLKARIRQLFNNGA